MSSHDASIGKPGTQTNILFKHFTEHFGEAFTPHDLIAVTGSSAPHTIVSAMRRQLPDGYKLEGLKVTREGKSRGAWRLVRDRRGQQMSLMG